MAAEFSDFRSQRIYEEGIRDAFEELFPNEPTPEDRAWFEDFMSDRDLDAEYCAAFDRDEREAIERENLADAMDEQWNWPHR